MPSDEVCTVEELRAIYRPPAGPAVAKEHATLDEHDRTFIGLAPFVLVGPAGADGSADVSPKGGEPGFVQILDDTTIAIPDLSGNHRLDSMENLLTGGGGIGLLFLIPGVDETLRVNGRARLRTDLEPKMAIVIDVEEVYLHCAKALRRAKLWQPEAWPSTDSLPSAGQIYKDQMGLADVPAEAIDADLEAHYATALWVEGGD